ncbi:MAG: peptide deformylase [Bacteroidota bacterium]|nr:peptide deformylase [Bacteroidota bacterium]
MFETMYKADGIGLAANQVGISKSLIVIDTSGAEGAKYSDPPIVMINPVIESFSDDEIDFPEGCLSVPKFYEKVIRPIQIQVRYYDLEMKEYVFEADEMLSRVMQHEIDHLNGVLFYEKLTPVRRALAKNKLKKIKRGDTIPFYPMIGPDGKKTEK